MNRTTLAVAGLLACSMTSAACGGDDDPITTTASVPNARLNVTTDADLMNVVASESVPLAVDAPNMFLVDPNDTPPPEHAADAVFLEFHIDVETSTPLLVTAETRVSVTIPADTAPGPHQIICRVHKHDDGAPTNVSFDLAIVVSARKDGAAAGAGKQAPSTAVF
jgi:hypothetical protein